MKKNYTLFILGLIVVSFYGSSISVLAQNQQPDKKNSLNPDLAISDNSVKHLDGAYSIVTVENGVTSELSIKFKKGQITKILVNGHEIPEMKWSEYDSMITEYINYIQEDDQKKYRYRDWYEIEYELRQDLNKINEQFKKSELNHKLKKFYDKELRDWFEEMEQEINQSNVIDDLESIFEDFIDDLDEFFAERKAYFNDIEKEKDK